MSNRAHDPAGADEIEIGALDLRGWLAERARQTPWWAISVAFHALALACLTLVTFSKAILKPELPAVVTIAKPAPRERLEVADLPRGPVDRAGPPAEDPLDAPDEPPPFAPGFEIGDHDETDSGEAYGRMKGDDMAFRSVLPGSGEGPKGRRLPGGPGASDALGVGGGGGPAGRHGGPLGGRRDLIRALRRPGGGRESWVLAGLRWLARHQGPDGGWHAETFSACCAPGTRCGGAGYADYDVGLTGLSLLAFLGAGVTHRSRDRYEDPHTHQTIRLGDVVRRGLRYLDAQQDAEGCFGPRVGEFVYNHAIATLALTEAYGMTSAAQFRPLAERGLAFLTGAQNPYRGWRYAVRPGDNDTSVTGWCVMALKSAELSGLPSSRSAFEGARAWIDSVTDGAGEVGYSGLGKVDVVLRGKNEAWCGHPSMTAVGLLCRIFIDRNPADPRLAKHAAIVAKDPPRWDERRRTIDFYYWYYGALALYQLDGPDGRLWRPWDEALREALGKHQKERKDGCEDGSWDPAVDRWGAPGGRIYATAINVLTLEVLYRYERVLGARRGERPREGAQGPSGSAGGAGR
jgi:hypothetical protein